MADLFERVGDVEVYRVRRYVEKPDRETAEGYFAAGNYLWNSGMFIWSVSTVLGLLEKHLPDTYVRLMRIRDALGTPSEAEVLDREYKQIERISVDYGIMEKLDEILVIPGDFGWNDIGSWETVYEIAAKDGEDNVILAPHVCLDTERCFIQGMDGKVVATIGVQDLIVVDTEDALLIARRDRAQDVKKIVDKLKAGEMEGYL